MSAQNAQRKHILRASQEPRPHPVAITVVGMIGLAVLCGLTIWFSEWLDSVPR